MKKIKNHRDLIAEKHRLLQQQKMLEQNIYSNWTDVKESLKPRNIAAGLFSNVLDRISARHGPSLSDKAGLLGGVLTKMAAEKLLLKLIYWLRKKY